jgi:hypothetical protein
MKVRLLTDGSYYIVTVYNFSFTKDFDVGGVSELVDGELKYPVLLYRYSYDYLLCYEGEMVYKFSYLTFAVNASSADDHNYIYGGNILYQQLNSSTSSLTFEYELFFFIYFFLTDHFLLGVVTLLVLMG